MNIQHITLTDLNNRIKKNIEDNLSDDYWVVAEINEMNINRTGHCYLELIDKDKLDKKITARARGTIWNFTFRMLRAYFETTTGKSLQSGLKVLLKVNVQYHEQYGLSLNVKDIDPVYTIGDLARKRQETIERLKNEGVFNINREIDMATIPQRIAIISSDTAAGYGDFINQLDSNGQGYKFYHKIFPAQMQGDQAAGSIIAALEHIYEYEDCFDVVVIIRGGGSKTDLACFDDFELAANVAQYPLPIISGIGHERDESVVDLVAHTCLKTPTAVAEYLINCFDDIANYLNSRSQFVVDVTEKIIMQEKEKLNLHAQKLKLIAVRLVDKKKNELLHFGQHLLNCSNKTIAKNKEQLLLLQNRMANEAKTKISKALEKNNIQLQRLKTNAKINILSEKNKINLFENKLTLLKPETILKRGFSITRKDGKVVRDINELQKGDHITTTFAKGTIDSTVN